jgi:hypothetical protein
MILNDQEPVNEAAEAFDGFPMPDRETSVRHHIDQLATNVASIDEQIAKAFQHREMLMHVIHTLSASLPPAELTSVESGSEEVEP